MTHEYVAIESEDAGALARKLEVHEGEGWELVTITAVGAEFEGHGQALFVAFMKRSR